MVQTMIEDEKLKLFIKDALLEILREDRDWFVDIFVEALEEYALAEAIDEGMASRTISREELFSVLTTDG